MSRNRNEADKQGGSPPPQDPPKEPTPPPSATGSQTQGQDSKVIWVISNRQDDRVVLHERDPRHPGGEAFVGGPAPDRVFRTPEVERLLHSGEMVEIPEPPDGPKKPVDVAPVVSQAAPAMPGQPIKLGRKLDPELVPPDAQREVLARQRAAPREIRSRATVPPLPTVEREETRS